MFCKYCGNQINENAVVCPQCGCAVVEEKKKRTYTSSEKKKITFNVMNYATVFFFSLALTFVLLAIVNYNAIYYSGTYLSSSYFYFFYDEEFFAVGLVFSLLSVCSAITGFIFGLFKENREKRFISDVLLFISLCILVITIVALE